jgi:hypothetical protein
MSRDMRGSGVIRVLVLLQAVVFPRRSEIRMLTHLIEVLLQQIFLGESQEKVLQEFSKRCFYDCLRVQ